MHSTGVWEMKQKSYFGEKVHRVKLYKKGKNWVASTLTLLSFELLMTAPQPVKAAKVTSKSEEDVPVAVVGSSSSSKNTSRNIAVSSSNDSQNSTSASLVNSSSSSIKNSQFSSSSSSQKKHKVQLLILLQIRIQLK